MKELELFPMTFSLCKTLTGGISARWTEMLDSTSRKSNLNTSQFNHPQEKADHALRPAQWPLAQQSPIWNTF